LLSSRGDLPCEIETFPEYDSNQLIVSGGTEANTSSDAIKITHTASDMCNEGLVIVVWSAEVGV